MDLSFTHESKIDFTSSIHRGILAIKLTHPLGTNTRFYWSIWDEVFLNLNDTDWGANNGLDRNRIFGGIGWKPNSLDYCKAEVGYLNQFIYRKSATDRMDHLLSLNVFFNF